MTRARIPFIEEYKITSAYGERVLSGKRQFHAGLDMVGLKSATVYAAAPGTVVSSTIVTDKSNSTWQWGNYVCIRTDDGFYNYYCHLKSRAVSAGQKVKAGDKIGVMGNTGYSFGAHLHFEVRRSDRKTSVSAAEYLGIINQTGTFAVPDYSLRDDLSVLVDEKVINSPNYWLANADRLPYLKELIHKMAERLTNGK